MKYFAPRKGRKIRSGSRAAFTAHVRKVERLFRLTPRARRFIRLRDALIAAPIAGAQALAAVQAPPQHPGGPGPDQGAVPFLIGSHEYSETNPSIAVTPGAATQDFVVLLTPGGFLRGVRLGVVGTGGALGGGALNADYPWNIFTSIALENVDGSEILYPMPGFTYYCIGRFFRPWEQDAAQQSTFVGTINANLSLLIRPEIRDTLGVLANTDARSQYRLRFTVNTLAGIVTGGAPTAPALTIAIETETWAQVDPNDLQGNPIQEVPDGMALQTLHRREIQNLTAANGANMLKHQNVGNELRGFMYIMRDGNGARQDLIGDPWRLRLDNRVLYVTHPAQHIDRIQRFYGITGIQSARPTGVYVYPRFRWGLGGTEMHGSYWLPTTNASFVQSEFTTAAGIAGTPTAESVTSEVIPTGFIAPELEGV